MAIEDAADRAQFFDTDEFAVSATYNGGATPIDVLFDNAYFEDRSGFAGVESSQPAALAVETDVPAAAQGDTLVIDGTTYTVTEVHPDGAGLVILMLRT